VGNPRSFPPRIVTVEARPATARQLTISAGDGQQGTVGRPIPSKVVLEVSDSLGNPVPDVPVEFHRTGRTAGDSVIRSGKDGRIHLRWTLARIAGPDGFIAHLTDGADSVRVTATARPGAADTVRFIDPPATAVAGRTAATTVRLRVADRYGNPVPGSAVGLGATAGKLSRTRATTDSNGVATVRWTPGAVAGTQTLTATVSGSGVRARHAVKVTAPAPASGRRRRK
jgi:hypothetical protein